LGLSNPPDRLLTRGKIALIALVVFAFLGAHYSLHWRPGQLTETGYGYVQAARFFVLGKRLNTQAIRPLDTSAIPIASDSSLPDFSHSLPYTAINAGAIRATKQIQQGRGEQAVIWVQLLLFALAAVLTGVLARRVFGPQAPVLRTVAFFVFASSGLAFALTPTPAFLGAIAMIGLLLALFELDEIEKAKQAIANTPKKARLWALVGGVCYGLLCLSIYSALVLFPVILWHFVRIIKQKPITIGLFFGAALLTLAPQFIRATLIAHNPLYHAAFPEIMMYTPTFPGESLYHEGKMPRGIAAYLSDGGLLEVLQKAGRHLVSSQSVLLTALGAMVVPLFLGAGLTRFRDNKTNHLRNFAYRMIVIHTVGLAFFAPPEQYQSVFLIYAPIVALLGAAFLESVVRARKLPEVYTRAVMGIWVGLACLPGVLVLLNPATSKPVTTVYKRLLARTPMDALYKSNIGPMATDIPEAFAYNMGYPALALPTDEKAYALTQEQLGEKIIAGVVLTPQILRYDGVDTPKGSALRSWASLANSLNNTLELQSWVSQTDVIGNNPVLVADKVNWNTLITNNLNKPNASTEIKGIIASFKGADGIARDEEETNRATWVFWAASGSQEQ
jgi:hypothetical protein